MDIRAIALENYFQTLRGNPAAQSLPADLSAGDAAFIKRLLLTALRRQNYIRAVINGFAIKKLPARPEAAQLAAFMGAAEILYFHTPDYAVVNSYVALAKKLGNKYSGGFVNAVLRKICQNRDSLLAADSDAFFPQNFTALLRRDYGKKTVAAIEKAALAEPPLDLTVKSDPRQWAQKLGGELMGNGSVRLRHVSGSISKLPGYEEGAWWVQDLASSLAVPALGDIRGKKVLDLCAAPGGKTAQLINAGALVTAVDISKPRLDTLRANLQRLSMKAEAIIAADALQYLQQCPAYDIIVVDAPCSATGTLRRHPEIVHTRSEKDIAANAALQQKMLELATACLPSQGILLYAVCSLCHAEGEKQIGDFVARHPEFRIAPISAAEINPFAQSGFNDLITSAGYIRCLPAYLADQGGMDGFFVAKLQKE